MSIQFKPKHTMKEIRKEMRSSKDGRYHLRLSLIELLIEQPNIKHFEIKEKLLISSASIYSWRNIYEQEGIDGLRGVLANGGNNNTQKVNQDALKALFKEIDKQKEYWSAPKMVEWLKENMGESIKQTTLYYHLNKNGYSHKSSRTHPYKADIDKQNSFKKTV